LIYLEYIYIYIYAYSKCFRLHITSKTKESKENGDRMGAMNKESGSEEREI
jgi:hypothetical protein